MTMSAIKLVGALSFLTVGSVMAQTSCVQLNATDLSSCPCDEATLTFTLEGQTSIAENTVNLALVLDGSSSIKNEEFALEKDFAEDTVTAFAARNLFANGGTASYVQFSNMLVSSGTFDSAEAFIEFSDNDFQDAGGGRIASIGITEGTVRLLATEAAAWFMIVITDGISWNVAETTVAADAARAEGITVFAVGVGDGTSEEELLAIGGSADNVFEVADFDFLDEALVSILSSTTGTVVPCPSTGATMAIEFSVLVDSTTSGTVSGTSTVTFFAADLESTPTEFDALLDVCDEVPGGSVIVSADYIDDQGNSPDLSLLTGLVVGDDFCAAPTPSPTSAPTASSTMAPTLNPTPSPTLVSPPCSTMKEPKRGHHLKKGWAKKSTYLGCYEDDSRHNPLNGHRSCSPHMTAQMCSDTCSSKNFNYFGTASSSECFFCGNSQPTRKGGKCDFECAGDRSTACGGIGCMSIFKHDHHRVH